MNARAHGYAPAPPAEGRSSAGPRRRWRVGLAVLAGLLAVPDAPAAPAADGTQTQGNAITLPEAVGLALAHNPGLRSLRARAEAMDERPAQAATLPNPMLEASGMDSTSGANWPDSGETRIGVAQEFPWFGKRSLREGVARKDAEVMRQDLAAMSRDVVMQVKESYFDLYAVQQAIAITRKDEDVLRRMAGIAETMYATGERSQQDVLKAKAEITMLKQRLLELGARENTLKATLNALLDRPANEPLGVAVTPPADNAGEVPETRFALAVTNRPEVLAAQAQMERDRLETDLMARESMPDYRLGAEYRHVAAGDDMMMVTLGIDLPIRRSRYRAAVREAEAMRRSSEAAREAAARQSALDIRDAVLQLSAARRTLALYRTELIPQAEARLNASEAEYRTGKADFMDLLESQRFLLNARVMAAMAEGTLGMQLARLERAAGTDLSGQPAAGGTGK